MLSPHIRLFKKIKRGLELVYLPHFLNNFWRKILLFIYSINWPNFIVWLSLLCEILGNMCIAIVSKPGCDAMNFEVKDFELKAFFLKSCYSRLRLWVGFFIYFKFTPFCFKAGLILNDLYDTTCMTYNRFSNF